MLGMAHGQEARLSRFLDIPHRFVSAGGRKQPVDAVISPYYGKDEAELYLPRLLHLPGAGADAIEFERLAPDCVVCNVFEHEIPIAENPPLAQALYRGVEVGQAIPAKLYAAVAEILAFLYRAQVRAQQATGRA